MLLLVDEAGARVGLGLAELGWDDKAVHAGFPFESSIANHALPENHVFGELGDFGSACCDVVVADELLQLLELGDGEDACCELAPKSRLGRPMRPR